MDTSSQQGGLRIGALSKRAGVTPHVLRAWETRYGLFAPDRSPGGFRLYSDEDLRRVRRMRAYLADGVSAAEAARAVLAEPSSRRVDDSAEPSGTSTLQQALDELDERVAHVVLDQLFGSLTIEAAVRDVLLPYLHDLGERWGRGEVTVGQEHFASNLIRSRLAGMSAGWSTGRGPRALLACPPGELHDIALLAFGLVLRRAGWRVTYLGADSPASDIEQTAALLEPDLVMLSAADPARFEAIRSDLVRLSGQRSVALAGPGASAEFADAVGAEHVAEDPVTAAERWADR
ncbi:MerR family transcriptional regulator [Kribbella sp. NPDC055071]